MLQQNQSQQQTLRILPQQIQMLNLLQLNAIELEQHIKTELEENPVLEEGKDEPELAEENFANQEDLLSDKETDFSEDFFRKDSWEDEVPDYKTRSDNYSGEEDNYTQPLVQAQSFRDDLKVQLSLMSLTVRQKALAEYMLDSLDDNGFLRFDLADMADDISFANNFFVEPEELENILKILHTLDPAGIGAKDLQECLLLQLVRKRNEGKKVDLAIRAVKECMPDLTNKNYEKIRKTLNIDENELRCVIDQITMLNPKPVTGQSSGINVNLSIYPEFVITVEENQIEIMLNGKQNHELRLNKSFVQMAQAAHDKQTAQFVKSKISAAQWLITALQQRENTMYITMKAITEYQKEYFMTGDIQKLKPMILKDIADMIKMDISTVSRVTSTRYVQTPFGLLLLKDLFSEGIAGQDGTEVSNREVQNAIADIVKKEDKTRPLTDIEIVEELEKKGYDIARRTVAKYREHLDIAPAKLRKKI
jgi:RNA polymerase sigma-54 factor